MGKANAKKKAWRDKLTLLNILKKRMKRAKFEAKVKELQSKLNSIKSKLWNVLSWLYAKSKSSQFINLVAGSSLRFADRIVILWISIGFL